ncbi:MAG: GntR family transcriptional regulator [Syntrophomonas sp.]|nr:GntR family transcriptional regulator [Syntrophomonas sp.]
MTGRFSNERPIFIQLAEMLEDAILSGAYNEGDQIPSITEFSVAYKINPATALKGVNILVDAGLLYKKRGVGMFVSRDAREKLAEKRKERFYRDFVEPMILEAIQLGISKSEFVEMAKRGLSEHGN